MPAIPLDDIRNSPLNKGREEMKASDLFPPKKPAAEPGKETMDLHIEIQYTASKGNAFTLHGTVHTIEDLDAVRERYKDYMPKTGSHWIRMFR